MRAVIDYPVVLADPFGADNLSARKHFVTAKGSFNVLVVARDLEVICSGSFTIYPGNQMMQMV